MKVITNSVPRDLLIFYDLSEKQQEYAKKEWDWCDEIEDQEFFIYKGELFCLADFLTTSKNMWYYVPEELKSWDGYGIGGYFHYAVKYPKDYSGTDYARIIVGRIVGE